MKMGKEDGSNIPDINSSFRNPTRRSIASVNDIDGSIDDQEVRGLRPMGSRRRTRRRPERNNPCTRLRSSKPGLRLGDSRDSRKRGSTRCQMQKLSALNHRSLLLPSRVSYGNKSRRSGGKFSHSLDPSATTAVLQRTKSVSMSESV
jgi:hypothetical protein